MENGNEKDLKFKKFLALISSGKDREAYALAEIITKSDYPAILKEACIKYINKNQRDDPPMAPSEHSQKLYNFISKSKKINEEIFSWLPAQHSSKQLEPGHTERENVYKELALDFASKGKNLLESINEKDSNTILAAIESFFDHNHYRLAHPDMQGSSREEALKHYAFQAGKEESREPNYLFRDAEFYDLYPWAKTVPVNPLYLFTLWPQEFSEYATLVVRRYRITQKTGAISVPAFCKQIGHTPFKLKEAEENRILKIVQEQSLRPKLIKTGSSKSLIIHIVIPDFTAGGGGHMTIFRMIRHLELKGHLCTVWVKDYNYRNHPKGASHSANKHYQAINAKVLPLSSHYAFASGEALIATSWDTVDIVLANKNFANHFYLVQDYEPFFYARGSQSLKAELTYSRDIKTICASTWLDEIMKGKFGKQSTAFDLAFNPDVYYPSEIRRADNLTTDLNDADNEDENNTDADYRPVIRIAFYGRSRTERRAVDLALEGLQMVKQNNFDLCVDLFGEEIGHVRLSSEIVAFDHGILTPHKLANLYRKCDIGLTFSATNYALVPQEMMACGLPVIEIDNDSTRAIYPPNSLILVEPSPLSIARAIETLAENKELRDRIALNGINWVHKHSWDKSFSIVENFIKTEVHNNTSANYHPSASSFYSKLPYKEIKPSKIRPPLVSVAIPTLNGGDLLQEVVTKVLSQSIDCEYELVIIDSMSNDCSISHLPKDPRIAIYEVEQCNFQHGRTRNLAISLAKGQYVAFLTQDAIPSNNSWLSNLLQPFSRSEEVVAVFGRHEAHDGHSDIIRKSLDEHFLSFANLKEHNILSCLDAYWDANPCLRQRMHFYSDNNSCLKKSFWEYHPYPDVDYGEDQLFADWIAQSESTKAYAHDALVKHSHQFTFDEEFKRCKTEAFFFAKYFGYDLSQTRIDIEKGIRDECAYLVSEFGHILAAEDLEKSLANIRAKREGYACGIKHFWRWMNQS